MSRRLPPRNGSRFSPRFACLVGLVVATLIASCGGDGSAEGPTQFGSERVVDVDGGVCGLLSQEDIEVLTSRDMGSGQQTVGANCDWKLLDNSLDDGVGVTLEVDPLSVYGNSAADYEAFLADGFGELVPIESLGDQAWATIPKELGEGVNSVAAVRGDVVVSLSALFLDIEVGSPQYDALVETMSVALDRLDEQLPSG